MTNKTFVDVSAAAQRSAATKQLAAEIEERITKRAMIALKRRLGPEANRQFSTVLNLKKPEISKRVTVTSGDGFVELTASGKRIALGKFGAKWGGHATAGATAQVFVGGQTKVYKSAFILPKGAVVARQLKGAKRVPRLPLQVPFGPDLGSVMVSRGTHGIVTQLNQFSFQLLSDENARLTAVEMQAI
jgi:hypothetical protein